jgi:hypothetical protein
MENILRKMAKLTLEPGLKINPKVMEYKSQKKAISTKDGSRIASNTERELLAGLMGQFMKEIGYREKYKAEEYIVKLMEEATRVNGRTI